MPAESSRVKSTTSPRPGLNTPRSQGTKSPRAATSSSSGALPPPIAIPPVPQSTTATTSTTSTMSFSELIRAREAQQRKLRDDLEYQNQQLRERLGLLASITGGQRISVPRDNDGGLETDWDEQHGSPASRQASPPFNGERGGGGQGSSAYADPSTDAFLSEIATSGSFGGPSKVGSVAAVDLVTFITNLKDSVKKGQDADKALMDSLHERLEAQSAAYEQRFAAIQTQLAVQQVSRDVDEEAFVTRVQGMISVALIPLTQRLDTLEAKVDSLTAEAGKLSPKVTELSTQLEQLAHDVKQSAVSDAVKESIDALTKRVVAAEEAAARSHNLNVSVADEEAFLAKQQQLDKTIVDGTAQLEVMEQMFSKLTHAAEELRASIDDTVNGRVELAQAAMREEFTDALQQEFQACKESQAALHKESVALGDHIRDTATQIHRVAAASIEEARLKYEAAVDEKLKEVVRRAEELEQERKLEFPTSDVDRVALMVQELEGAMVLLEGVAKNTAIPADVAATRQRCPLQSRIEKLEQSVDMLESKVQADFAPRIMFSVDCQAGPLEWQGHHHHQTPSSSLSVLPSHALEQRVERHLRNELDVAASHSAVNQLALLASGHSPRRSTSPLLLQTGGGNGTSPHPSRNPSPRYSSHFTAPSLPHPPPQPGSVRMRSPTTTTTTVQARLQQIAEAKERKETAVVKIIAILREIQNKFHELTLREAQLVRSTPSNHHHHSSSSYPQHSADAAALLAQQKEAVFQKERQLVEQRNQLWAELGDLQVEEDELLESLERDE